MLEQARTDYLIHYEQAVEGMKANPNDLEIKHKAVLALARMGSFNFARSEYERYGLDKVRHHEDIMGLGARLFKDKYLSSSGKTALEHARNAAEKYELAFKDTEGYYSGINSATMALLANMPWEIIKDRVETILNILPDNDNLTSEEHYFIEATRAECFLILGEIEKSRKALSNAIKFDPLNYAAHASTLKQFKLILDKRNGNGEWLSNFKPPQPVHFAGHLWSYSEFLGGQHAEILSDLIQRNDIGFGYGALAAGADISIAEALLAEGAELNVILPCSVKSFLDQSVKPYGDPWIQRFETCIEMANTVTCLPDSSDNKAAQNILSARMAMGQSIFKSEQLDIIPAQLLMIDPKKSNSFTALHKRDWVEMDLKCYEVFVEQKITQNSGITEKYLETPILLLGPGGHEVEEFETLHAAMERVPKANMDMFALHFKLPDAENSLKSMMMHKISGQVLVSEAVASYAILKYREDFKVTFAGSIIGSSGKPIRTYTIRAKI